MAKTTAAAAADVVVVAEVAGGECYWVPSVFAVVMKVYEGAVAAVVVSAGRKYMVLAEAGQIKDVIGNEDAVWEVTDYAEDDASLVGHICRRR